MAKKSWSDRRIALYSLRVEVDKRRMKTNDDREPFVANFDGGGSDLLHFISSFVEALPLNELIEKDERHFGQPTDIKRVGRSICWSMDGGESGRTTSIRLARTGRKRKRKRSGVEWEPFWVYALIPRDSNHGWLLSEKSGNHALPTEWRTELVAQFANAYPGYRLRIGVLREMSLWAQVENALDEGRLIGFEVAERSSETSSSTGAAGYERGMAQYEKHIWRASGDAREGRVLRQFRRRFTKTLVGTREVELPIEVDDLSDDQYEIRLRDEVAEIKATVLNSEGKPKTVVFEGLDPQQLISMEGTAGVQPNRQRFLSECQSAVQDLAASNGMTLAPGWNTGSWKHPEDAITLEVRSDEPTDLDREDPEDA